MSKDTMHLKYPLVVFGSEGSALNLPPFLLSPRIIMLCHYSSTMTKDHFLLKAMLWHQYGMFNGVTACPVYCIFNVQVCGAATFQQFSDQVADLLDKIYFWHLLFSSFLVTSQLCVRVCQRPHRIRERRLPSPIEPKISGNYGYFT